jgi:hypothetical protein
VGRIRKRKTAKDIQACFAKLRACYPIQIRIYVVMDNLSANIRAAKDYFPGHNMEAVYVPTNASWLNAIESEFTALHADTIKNSDDPNHSAASGRNQNKGGLSLWDNEGYRNARRRRSGKPEGPTPTILPRDRPWRHF